MPVGLSVKVISITDLRGVTPGSGGGGTGGGSGGATSLDELSDVTIVTPLINESLIFNGAGQWVNKLTPQLETSNIWTNYQEYTPFAVGTGPSGTDGQFFTEVIDASNTGLFVNLNQAGLIKKVRLA